jgi:transposase
MLFVGDDWAEDHHDVEIVDDAGQLLVRRRLPEGLEGVTRLHALVAEQMPEAWADLDPGEAASRVTAGIETDRGPWVGALVAAGYSVFAINPLSVSRYRERHSTSGAKSDAADAHLLAEIVRLDRAHHRPVAGDTDEGEAIKLTARTHQSLIWDRTRHVLRLRSTLRGYFPVALQAFEDLDAPEVLELLAIAPDPDQAARPSRATITTLLKRARRRHVEDRAQELVDLLRTQELRQPPVLQDAYAAITASEVAVIATLNVQIERLGTVVGDHFGRHRDAEIYTSLPGLGVILSARILGEFGHAPDRYLDA